MRTSLSLAAAAGMLAAVNPCGVALLPAYLSLLVRDPRRDGERDGRTAATGRALLLSAAMTVGFTVLFGLFGLAWGPVTDALQRRLPWFSVVFGLLLAAAGCWLAAGRAITVPGVAPRARRVTGSVPSMVLFGAAYALASLGCTIGPFLAVVVAALRADGAARGAALFLAYGAGMGLVVATAALATALASTAVLRVLRRAGAALHRVGGGVLVASGGYVAYHGWYEARLLSGAGAGDPVVRAADAVQQRVAGVLAAAGAPPVVWTFVALLAVAGAAALAGARRRARSLRPQAVHQGADQGLHPGVGAELLQ